MKAENCLRKCAVISLFFFAVGFALPRTIQQTIEPGAQAASSITANSDKVRSLIPGPQGQESSPFTSQGFSRINSLTFATGEDKAACAVIDQAAGFAYFGLQTIPGRIVKVRLSDFTRVGALTFNPGEEHVASALIDPAAGFAYFGTFNGGNATGIVVKVRLSDFTRVGALTLNEILGTAAVIDSSAGFAYFGSSTNPYKLIKVRLSDFTEVGTLTLNSGELPSSAVIDTAAGFAYFGTQPDVGPNPGVIVKIRLSDFTRVGSLTVNPGEKGLISAVIDTPAGFAYFGSLTDTQFVSNIGVIVKVRLSDFTEVGSLTLNSTERFPAAAVIDTSAGFAYFGTITSPGIVVKVRLSDLARIDAITLNSGENSLFPAVIDNSAGFAYFGALTSPGQVIKLDVSDGAAALPTVQFSAPSYSIGEGDLRANIAVTRSGDTSASTTVDYRTVDADTFALPCSAKQGEAYGRCDFATVAGTLSFAAGEVSKSFSVPIIDDSYAEGTEGFSVALSNPSGAILGSPMTATVIITDNEMVDGPNPIFQTNPAGVSFFVRQHYLDFLGREPEPGEPWSAILNGCANQFNTDPNSPSANCDRITVSGDFFGSPEFKTKGIYVIDFYRVAFNSLPTYSEFAQDLASVTGATAAETNAKRAAFAAKFVQRPEFTNIYGAQTNTNFVNALMAGSQGQNYNLSSITTPDPANPDGPNKVTLTTADLINQLNGGTLTRAQVLRAIVQSDQITQNLESVNAFVASQYYGYLRRTPDNGGFNSWVTYLKNHPDDFRTMINGFLNSNEYRLRFGPL
jgi:Calx-beta domain-containing protein